MRPPIVPDLRHEMRESAWLSGFIDGEGSLSIRMSLQEGLAYPTLEMSQRDDDAALMAEVATALGGCFKRRSAQKGQPWIHVVVANKAALLGVVAYLDRFPLRTRKAAEYVVWRGAVFAYVEDGGRSLVLSEAHARIQALKVYVPTLMEAA